MAYHTPAKEDKSTPAQKETFEIFKRTKENLSLNTTDEKIGKELQKIMEVNNKMQAVAKSKTTAAQKSKEEYWRFRNYSIKCLQ